MEGGGAFARSCVAACPGCSGCSVESPWRAITASAMVLLLRGRRMRQCTICCEKANSRMNYTLLCTVLSRAAGSNHQGICCVSMLLHVRLLSEARQGGCLAALGTC